MTIAALGDAASGIVVSTGAEATCTSEVVIPDTRISVSGDSATGRDVAPGVSGDPGSSARVALSDVSVVSTGTGSVGVRVAPLFDDGSLDTVLDLGTAPWGPMPTPSIWAPSPRWPSRAPS
ncbi:MAG: hypothetical protein AAFV86_23130 [Pseudomonadota bacterium]